MPPKVSFTREMVLDCAFAIVRREGLESLSARGIAEELGCSTRPVYCHFASMTVLEEAVMQKARQYALDYFVRRTGDSDSPFLNLGMRYFHFSQEEPELFKLLYLEGRMNDTPYALGSHFSPLLEEMRRDPRLAGLSKAELKRLGTDSWIYAHGLISLIYAARPENAEEFVRTHLCRIGPILLGWEREHAKGE